MNTYGMVTCAKNGIFKPKVFLAAKEPEFVEHALQQEHWKTAMTDEILALIRKEKKKKKDTSALTS